MDSRCRLCGTADTSIRFERPDTYFWHGPVRADLTPRLIPDRMNARLMVCHQCGFLGQPLDDDLRRLLNLLYTSPGSMPGTTHGRGNPIAEARLKEFFGVLGTFGLGEVPRRVLEVGCQEGFLLAEFLRQGASQAVGIEPGDVPVFVEAGPPFPDVRRGYLSRDLLRGATFDFAYALQVFEHVESPSEFLKILHEALAPDGLLLLAVPNEEAALSVGYPGAFIFQHLNLFTPLLLERILTANGFSLLATISRDDMPLYVLARKVSRMAGTSPDGAAARHGAELLQVYGERLDAVLARAAGIADGRPDETVGLWGANVATANLYAWLPGARDRHWHVFDTDPHKIGRRMGGIPRAIEGPEGIESLHDLIVVPFNAQRSIEGSIRQLAYRGRVHTLYGQEKLSQK